VLLVADLAHFQQSGARQFFQFTLNSADADSGGAHNLVEIEALLGVAEEQAENLTLGLGE
jgi:hypothetical protein